MGSMLDEIRAAARDSSHRGPQCTVNVALAKLSKPDRDGVEEALADPAIPASIIRRVLIRHGHPLGKDAVARHRRGECACGRH